MEKEFISSVNTQLEEVGKFIKFGRKTIVNNIKESVTDCYETYEHRCAELSDKVESVSQILEDQKHQFFILDKKYSLVSNFLSKEASKHTPLENFNFLIENDFIEFANKESSLAEEAQVLLVLQDIQKRIEDIVHFPSIYNKNIVAVGGGFSAGKSEFLNSFFTQKEIKLPVGINPVTAIPTYITSGEQNLIKGFSYKGGVVELTAELYKQLSHDFIKSLGFNLKDIAPLMAIETPIESYNHICFVDTPGYNPSNTGYTEKDSDTSKEYLKYANTLLWVIGIDTNGTIPASDLDFLEDIALEDKKIYIIANKADLRSNSDVEDILDTFEELLDEYDIEYEGISAFSAIGHKEYTYRKQSLFDFLAEVNNPVEVKQSILAELNSVFDMYKNAINSQIEWTKNIQSHFKSLELDLLESGMDVDGSEKVDERLEKMKDFFKTSYLEKQLQELNQLREKALNAADEIFDSLVEKEE